MAVVGLRSFAYLFCLCAALWAAVELARTPPAGRSSVQSPQAAALRPSAQAIAREDSNNASRAFPVIGAGGTDLRVRKGGGGGSPVLKALDKALDQAMKELSQHIFGYIDDFCRRWSIPYAKGDSSSGAYVDPYCKAEGHQDKQVVGFFTQVVQAFPKSQYQFIDAIGEINLPNVGLRLDNVYADAIRKNIGDMRNPFTSWSGFFKDGKHSHIQVKAGGGFGFGFQVYCGCALLVDTGMGFGGGLDAQNKGGLGGGGGLQLYRDGKKVASLGGGGGGDLAHKFGASEDDDQTTGQSKTIDDLKKNILEKQIAACPKGKVSVTAGGGAGLGFTIIDKGSDITRWGGGMAVKASSKNFKDNDRACGGKLSQQGQQDTNIDEGQKKCRIKCQEDPQTFNTCFCSCTKQAYIKSGHAWAKHIRCSGGGEESSVVHV